MFRTARAKSALITRLGSIEGMVLKPALSVPPLLDDSSTSGTKVSMTGVEGDFGLGGVPPPEPPTSVVDDDVGGERGVQPPFFLSLRRRV